MPTYLLVSLPNSIVSSNDREDAFKAVQNIIPSSEATLVPFNVPEFKIGTLDALVQQADELSKLDASTEGTVVKTSDVLKAIFDGDESRAEENKLVNEKPFDTYISSFEWNRTKYRSDKPVGEIVDILKKEIGGLDSDIKAKYAAFQSSKANLLAIQRKQQGNLSTRSLATIVRKEHFIPESEYLTSILVAVPKSNVKEFLNTYETICEMVVPRSANKISEDGEYTLFSVVVFKKHSAEFTHKCRESKWVPRDFSFSATSQADEAKETKSVEEQVDKLWGETLRLGRTAYSECVASWMHVKTLRVFVETVLRYGLPLEYVSGIFMERDRRGGKYVRKAKDDLEKKYDFLGGNAYGRDKKGKIKRKDEVGVAEFTATHGAGEDYAPFVEYLFELS